MIVTGSVILIGLIPKAGAVVAGIGHPVPGGAAPAMSATVAVVGIRTLSRAPERAAALIETAKVAGHRFADPVAGANPIAGARTRSFGRGSPGTGQR